MFQSWTFKAVKWLKEAVCIYMKELFNSKIQVSYQNI